MAMKRDKIEEIHLEAVALGMKEFNIIPCQVMSVTGFDFEKYIEIKKNSPTIFAPNCWGGITYKRLSLQFKSPFINMFEDHDDYIKFLKKPEYYLKCELKFKQMQYEKNLKRDFPVASCDDILLYFNHYISFEEARNSWERRKTRINWNNLFVMFYDEKPERIDEFCLLSYDKKICFVSFHLDKEGVISIEYHINDSMREMMFGLMVNDMAKGTYTYYDVFDLILYNKVTLLAELKD